MSSPPGVVVWLAGILLLVHASCSGAQDSDCGNGIVEAGEECDDANSITGDGCEATCRFSCRPFGSSCDDDDPCTADRCRPHGEGLVCMHVVAPDAPCNDGQACTLDDRCDASGVCRPGPAGPPPPPDPLAPENGALSGSPWASPERDTLRPRFRWKWDDDGCGPAAFELQLDDSCAPGAHAVCRFASPEREARDIRDSFWQPDTPLAVEVGAAPVGLRYYWRVRACRGPLCSSWSALRYVDVGRVPSDYNGDGWSDILVGAPDAESPGDRRGHAYVFLGGTPTDALADLVVEGSVEWLLGSTVRSAGDVNADGFGDWLAVAPGAGGAFLFLGGADPDDEADMVLEPVPDDSGWWTVAGVGDVNADGYADLALSQSVSTGAPYGGSSGLVRLYPGGEPPSTVAAAEFSTAHSSGDSFGSSLAPAGDFDGDGFADLLVGANGANVDGHFAAGRAYLFFGGTDGLERRILLEGEWDKDAFGESLRGVGDVNGDGYADALVGAPGWASAPGDGIRRVELYLGGESPDAERDLRITGATAFPAEGIGGVAGGGDFNGDGYADFVVTAPGVHGGYNPGVAHLFLGGPAPSATPTATLRGLEPRTWFGVPAGLTGDVNGDGYSDLVLGEWGDDTLGQDAGAVHVFFGSEAPNTFEDLTLRGEMEEGMFGVSLGM